MVGTAYSKLNIVGLKAFCFCNSILQPNSILVILWTEYMLEAGKILTGVKSICITITCICSNARY